MKCPWCEAEFLSDGDFWGHILEVHPEKGQPTTEVFQQVARAQLAHSTYVNIIQAAATLTRAAEPYPSKEAALEAFRFFLGELMKLGGRPPGSSS